MDNKKIEVGGVIVIIVFLSLFILPFIVLYLNGEFNKLTLKYKLILIVIQLSFLFVLIFNFVKGTKCDENNCKEDLSLGIYNENLRVFKLFTKGGFKNFQLWYASLAGNVWVDLLFTMVIFFIPFPFLPEDKFSKVELFFVKLGIYKFSLAIFLGSPRYVLSDYIISEMTVFNKSIFGIVVVVSSILFILMLTDFVKKNKIKIKK
tara:strand:+ start:238 stop:852 length:615 start_codon:yes stop_codon:yes gene_type:complete